MRNVRICQHMCEQAGIEELFEENEPILLDVKASVEEQMEPLLFPMGVAEESMRPSDFHNEMLELKKTRYHVLNVVGNPNDWVVVPKYQGVVQPVVLTNCLDDLDVDSEVCLQKPMNLSCVQCLVINLEP